MRQYRFFGHFDFSTKKLKVFDKELINQVKNVLRLKRGSDIILADNNLNEAAVKITDLDNDFLELEIIRKYLNKNEPKRKIRLNCAILKKENFEWVIAKATEVGVMEIIPIITERTIKINLRFDRLNKIIKESAEQSGRGFLPILKPVVELKKLIEADNFGKNNFLFDSSGKEFEKVFKGRGPGDIYNIFIGPEGGWVENELALVRAKKIEIVSLGTLVLRAETAAIVSSYLVISKNNED